MNAGETTETRSRREGVAWGGLIADALAMPVHWYYNRAALRRDYGEVSDYLAPRNPHADSILWRSSYSPVNEKGDILHDQAQYWGQREIHYHQFLEAGENTLNLQLGYELLASMNNCGGYQQSDYTKRYLEMMLVPGRHRDTYLEEYHRNFFTRYAQGVKPEKCGVPDIHIGGLAHVGLICAWYGDNTEAALAAVALHVGLTHPAPEILKVARVLTELLCRVIGGADLRESIEAHATEFFSRKASLDRLSRPDHEVVGAIFSSACYIEDAFPASLYLSWKYAEEFARGVLANVNLGGDNCHRGAVIGALLGAAGGVTAIPARFKDGLRRANELSLLLERMLKGSSHGPA